MTLAEAMPIQDFNELLDVVFDDRVTQWTAEAEETERFPRKLIEYLGEAGVFAAKWPAGNQQSDVAKVIALARKLAGGPRVALRYMKRNMNAAETQPLSQCLDLEAMHHTRTGFTDDHKEAAKAFVEKREPVFRGR